MSDKRLLIKLAADVEGLKAGMKQARKAVDDFKDQVSKVNTAILGTFGAIGAQQVVGFAVEISRLAGQVDGVKQAFDKLPGSITVMNHLRQATNNTVSDLELMKAAVQASNFKIPIEQLGQLFSFAYERAKATGQSVDYLVQSIVTGIGRKSPLILDNLGISAVALKEKLNGVSTEAATIGDVAKAVGAIATEELEKMGKSAVTTAEDIAKAEAAWENFKASLGKTTAPLISWLSQLGIKVLDAFSTDAIDGFNDALYKVGQLMDGKITGDFAKSFNELQKAAAAAGIDLKTYNSDLAYLEEVLVRLRSGGQINAGLIGPSPINFSLPVPPINKATDEAAEVIRQYAKGFGYASQKNNPLSAMFQSPTAEVGGPNIAAMQTAMQNIVQSGQLEQLRAMWEQNDQAMQQNIQTAVSLSTAFGDSFAQVIDGSMSAGQAFSNYASSMVNSIGRIIMAKMIEKALDDKATNVNFFAKLALVGVAVGAASALLKKIGASGGSAGGTSIGSGGSLSRGIEGGTRLESLGQRVQLVGNVQFDIAGDKLVGVLKNQDRFNSRTKTT